MKTEKQEIYKGHIIEPYFNGYCTVFRYYKEGIEPFEEGDWTGDSWRRLANFETCSNVEDCKLEIDLIEN